jgi:hypothetical protein
MQAGASPLVHRESDASVGTGYVGTGLCGDGGLARPGRLCGDSICTGIMW